MPDPRFPFSNFIDFDLPYLYRYGPDLLSESVVFQSPEQYYQAMKSEDPAVWRKIAKLPSNKAKREGNYISIRSDWEDIKVEVMKIAMRHRFLPGTPAYYHLVDPMWDTVPIVEYNTWHDNFWGVCTCSLCTFIEGQNVLGKILMELREEHMKRRQLITCKCHHSDALAAGAVYIGRPEIWGNPWSSKEGTRARFKTESKEESVFCYLKWLMGIELAYLGTKHSVLDTVHTLRGKRLVCWCRHSPATSNNPCHGDVLAYFADKWPDLYAP